MKIAALILTCMLPFTAFAENARQITCVESSGPAGEFKRTMVLRQLDGGMLEEDQAYPFQFELYGVNPNQPLLALPVIVTTRDVIVNFASDDGTLTGTLFRDELDQTGVRLNGEEIGFDCN